MSSSTIYKLLYIEFPAFLRHSVAVGLKLHIYIIPLTSFYGLIKLELKDIEFITPYGNYNR